MEEIIDRAKEIQDLIGYLQNNPLFESLSLEQMTEFANRANFHAYNQGEKIIQQGQTDSTFFILVKGQLRAVDISSEPPHLLSYMEPGQVVGVRALLLDKDRAATVEVVSSEPARLARFNRKDLDWLREQDDSIIDHFHKMEAQRISIAERGFPGKQPDEVIVFRTKRHFLEIVSNLTVPTILLIIPTAFLITIELAGIEFLSVLTTNFWVISLVILPFLTASLALILYRYVDWINDEFILTTKRVVHIERKLIFGEDRHEALLTKIENVVTQSQGLLDIIFDCDDLFIYTAGAGTIEMHNIKKATEMKNSILQQQELAKARVASSQVASLRKTVAQGLGWQHTIEENTMPLAEEEGPGTYQLTPRRLPVILGFDLDDILLPNFQTYREIQVGGTKESAVVWRRHYLVLLTLAAGPFLTWLASLYLWIDSLFALWLLSGFEEETLFYVSIVLGITTLAAFIWFAWQYDTWRKDLYMVTDSRIVDITGSAFNLQGEKRREGSFDSIQNVYYIIPNLLYQFVNLGDVVIETASTEGTFTFKQVLSPASVQAEIFRRSASYQQKQREEARAESISDIIEVLATYQDLSQRQQSTTTPTSQS